MSSEASPGSDAQPGCAPQPPSAQAVVEFLDAHPDFFERHPDALAQVNLPSAHGGRAISLHERQLEVLRERNRQLGQKLADLVRIVVNNLNGNHVLITADHGFLFSERPPSETDKSKLSVKPQGTVLAKKRYLLGEELGPYEDALHGKTRNTAGTDDAMEFWTPKGVNRFHFAGGARFVHGGAMPQEIVVPVITVRHFKSPESRDKTKSRQVAVNVLGANHRITTPRHRFQLLQMEPVSERVKPVTLKAAVYEGDVPVTNIETVTFDSASDSMGERQKDIYLVLQDRHYDKKTAYRLALRDADSGIEVYHVTVIIDRAITDDF